MSTRVVIDRLKERRMVLETEYNALIHRLLDGTLSVQDKERIKQLIVARRDTLISPLVQAASVVEQYCGK